MTQLLEPSTLVIPKLIYLCRQHFLTFHTIISSQYIPYFSTYNGILLTVGSKGLTHKTVLAQYCIYVQFTQVYPMQRAPLITEKHTFLTNQKMKMKLNGSLVCVRFLVLSIAEAEYIYLLSSDWSAAIGYTISFATIRKPS